LDVHFKSEQKMGTNNLNFQTQNLEQGLKNYIHSLNLDNEEQDLVQQTFLNAIKKKSDKGNLNSLTESLHMKAFINNYRKLLLQKPAVNTDNLFHIYRNEAAPDMQSIFNLIATKINRLDKKLIDPFNMYVQGMSYNEIAEKTKLKTETVKSRIFMARSLLMIQE
jgi:DNA-directed RNA polymerase specialized sigma24 family protein